MHSQRQIIYNWVKTQAVSERQPWQLLWKDHIEINRGHSSHSSISTRTLPLQTSQAPCGRRRTVTKLLKGEGLNKTNAPSSVHLPPNASKNRTHKECWMQACVMRPEAIRNMFLWEYISLFVTHGTAQIKHVGIQLKLPHGVGTRAAVANALDWWYTKISLGSGLVLEPGPVAFSLLPFCLFHFGTLLFSLSLPSNSSLICLSAVL